MKMRPARLVGLVMAGALVLGACASDDGADDTDDTTAEETSDDGGDDAADDGGDDAADDGGDDAAEDASGETFEVYALLPQGNDQPYGTTYLPPMQATADELGLNLTITNSQYDADKQASECEVAIAAEPDGIILWPAVADTVRPCLEARGSP